MKITFICGSLEPGKDGVGDYTIRLATELNRNNYEISIIAINDVHLLSNYDSSEQTIEAVKIFRLSSNLSSKLRFLKANKWIDQMNPEWISLQYVSFSYHQKGLPFYLKYELAKLGKGRKWHIMFHELWVGMPISASNKHIFWGWMQKIIIKSLLEKLRPEVTHANCELYVLQLKHMSVEVSQLPLFSNVPVLQNCKTKGICDSLKLDSSPCLDEVSIIMFGTIHPQAFLDKFLYFLDVYRQKSRSIISLTLVGNSGKYKKDWIDKFKKAGISVHVHGEQHVKHISKLLLQSTFGVSTSALPTIDKSGTVAAMLEHGLPVICVGDCWKPRKLNAPKPPSGVYKLQDGCIEEVLSNKFSNEKYNSVSIVANKFVESLQKRN